MKTKYSFYTIISIIVLSILAIQPGCKKDNPVVVKKKNVWAVGSADSTNYALIYFSADGGENWMRQGEGQAALQGAYLNDVWAVDENVVWAIGENNIILKTTDGGINWNRITPPSQRTNIELVSISIIGKDDIWISGSYGTVYHSTDGGDSWTSIQSDVLTDKYLQGIHAIDVNIVYVTGGYEGSNTRGFIARTTDAGQTWDSIVPSDNYNRNLWIGITSSDPDNIVVYGGHSHYIYSNNSGQSWKNDSVPNTGGTGGADINCLKMPDAQTWWGAFDYDGIFITENGSSSWTNQGPAPGAQGMWLLGIDYYDKNNCVIVGSASMSNTGKIIQTSNGGQLWILKESTDAWMQKVSFIK